MRLDRRRLAFELGIDHIELPAGLRDLDTQVGNLVAGVGVAGLFEDLSVRVAGFDVPGFELLVISDGCLLYTSPSPRDRG